MKRVGDRVFLGRRRLMRRLLLRRRRDLLQQCVRFRLWFGEVAGVRRGCCFVGVVSPAVAARFRLFRSVACQRETGFLGQIGSTASFDFAAKRNAIFDGCSRQHLFYNVAFFLFLQLIIINRKKPGVPSGPRSNDNDSYAYFKHI